MLMPGLIIIICLDKSRHLLTTKCCRSLDTSAWVMWYCYKSGHLLASKWYSCLKWTKIAICSLQSDPVVWTSVLGKVLLVSGLKICLDKSLQCPVDIRSLQSDAGVWTGQKSTSAHYKVILLSGHICSVQSDAGVWTSDVAKSLDEAEASATGIGLPAHKRMCPTRLDFSGAFLD